MQTGNPRRLKLEHVLVGFADLERLLHEMWEPFAIRSADRRRTTPGTEWFRPEVREQLPAAIQLAAERQAEYLRTLDDPEVSVEELERIVRRAHGDLDIEVHKRDVPRLLASGGGYVQPHTTRV